MICFLWPRGVCELCTVSVVDSCELLHKGRRRVGEARYSHERQPVVLLA